ncbi:MAG: DUF167 family protein [Candidatus Diapherotrites archaeon]
MNLEVIPNSKEFSISLNQWTNALRVKVKGKALKGKANKELIQELEKLFQTKVEIKSGEKSKKKKILLKEITQEQLQNTFKL